MMMTQRAPTDGHVLVTTAAYAPRHDCEVTVKTVEPTPIALVAAAATWAEFPKMWGPMDKVWSFLRGEAPEGLCKQGHNIMLYKDEVPTSKSAFR
jgi:hypothetical protein